MSLKNLFYSSYLTLLATYGVQARCNPPYLSEIEKDTHTHFLRRENALISAPKLNLILGELKNKPRPKLIRQNAVDFSARPQLERKKAIYNIHRHIVLNETSLKPTKSFEWLIVNPMQNLENISKINDTLLKLPNSQILQNHKFEEGASIAIEEAPINNFKALTSEEAKEQLDIALNMQQAFHQRKFTEFSNVFLKPETKESPILGPTLNPLLDVILGEVVSISKLQNGHVRRHASIPEEFMN